MKKFAIPLIIALILSAFTFTSCGDSPLIAPEDQWCMVTTKVKNQDIDLYFYYTKTSGKKVTFSGNTEKDLLPGLTIIAIGNVTPTQFVSAQAMMKTFKINEEVGAEGEGETESTATNKVKFKAAMWDAIFAKFYKSGMETNVSATTFKYCTEASSFAALGSQFANMTWKDIAITALEML